MKKINKVCKIEDLPDDAIQALYEKYPEGWKDYVRKIQKPSGDFFYAISVDTDEISYLVKVRVNIDSKSELEKLDYDFSDKNAEREAANHLKEENGASDDIDDDDDDYDDDEDDEDD